MGKLKEAKEKYIDVIKNNKNEDLVTLSKHYLNKIDSKEDKLAGLEYYKNSHKSQPNNISIRANEAKFQNDIGEE